MEQQSHRPAGGAEGPGYGATATVSKADQPPSVTSGPLSLRTLVWAPVISNRPESPAGVSFQDCSASPGRQVSMRRVASRTSVRQDGAPAAGALGVATIW